MRTLAVIPARGGSRRVLRKNLAELGGRSLVRRALETALGAQSIDAVVLSSDDDEILEEGADLDVLCLRRPPGLATDTARSYDVAVHAVAEADAYFGCCEIVALMQCSTPFATPADIDGALGLLERSGAASVVTVTAVPDLAHPDKLKIMQGDRVLPFGQDDALRPSHDLQAVWVRNGALYASRRAVLDGGALIAHDLVGYPMPPERSVDINTPLDLAFARFLIERGDHK